MSTFHFHAQVLFMLGDAIRLICLIVERAIFGVFALPDWPFPVYESNLQNDSLSIVFDIAFFSSRWLNCECCVSNSIHLNRKISKKNLCGVYFIDFAFPYNRIETLMPSEPKTVVFNWKTHKTIEPFELNELDEPKKCTFFECIA